MALKDEITKASKSIEDIKNPSKSLNISNYLLTDYQIAKKMVQQSMKGTDDEITEEDAQFIVYGKLMLKGEGVYEKNISEIYVDNEVKYPDCVDKNQGIPSGSPQIQWIKDTIKKVLDSIAQLAIKIADLGKEIISCMFQIIQSIIALAASAVLMPIGSGLPVGLAAIKTMIASIKNLQSKVADFIPILQPIEYVELIAPSAAIIVEPAIAGLSGIFSAIDKLTSFIPAGSSPPEIPFSAGAITKSNPAFQPETKPLELDAEYTKVPEGNKINVTLKATARQGSWEYDYKWTGPNGFNANQQEVTIEGFYLPGDYTITITDKNNPTATATKNLTVTLI